MGKRKPYRCPLCDHGYSTEEELQKHCSERKHQLPSSIHERTVKGGNMKELLALLSSTEENHNDLPSETVHDHPAISQYYSLISSAESQILPNPTSISLNPSTSSSSSQVDYSSSSSREITSSSPSFLSGRKRTNTEIYEEMWKEYEVISFDNEAKEEFLYYFIVLLSHNAILSASRIFCLLPHRQSGKDGNLLLCRDTSIPSYNVHFKVHVGNLRKHVMRCHPVRYLF